MNLSTNLSQLERAQLVRSLDDKMMAYLFKHVLVQETTYATLLKQDRQRLHRAVAQTMERTEAERLNENAARLAQHFAEAGDDVKALEYTMRAGEYAASMFANAEAIMQYEKALTILTRHHGTAREFLEAYKGLGRALQLSGQFERALENYSALEQEGRTLGDASLELTGLVERATIYATPTSEHDPKQGAVLNARALELARELGDPRAECKALWNLLLIAYFNGEPEMSVAYGERALALARELNWQEMEAYILNDISRPLISIGPISRSLESLDRARTLFQAQNNLPMLADNLTATGETLLIAGEYERAMRSTTDAIALSHTLNSIWNLAYSGFNLMIVNTELGNLDRVFSWVEELNSLPSENFSILFMYGSRAWLAEAYRLLGDPTRGIGISAELETWAEVEYPMGVAWLRASSVRDLVAAGQLELAAEKLTHAYQENLGDYSSFGPVLVRVADMELGLAQQNPEHVLQVSDAILFDLERLGIQMYRAHVYSLRGQAFAQQRRWDDSVEAFERAVDYAARLPMRRVLWETYAAWADVEETRGNPVGAQTLRARAREYLEYIADHAGSPANREMFLAQPAVRALYAATSTLL